MMEKIERRNFLLRELRVAGDEDGDAPRIEGYAAVFNQKADLG